MLELTVVDNLKKWQKLKTLVLDSVSSPITRGIYNMALDEFVVWYAIEPRPGFARTTVNAWRVSLEVRKLSSSSINVRLSAVRKLALEAARNGLLDVKKLGVRIGQWLSLQQAQTLLNAPDAGTLKGLLQPPQSVERIAPVLENLSQIVPMTKFARNSHRQRMECQSRPKLPLLLLRDPAVEK